MKLRNKMLLGALPTMIAFGVNAEDIGSIQVGGLLEAELGFVSDFDETDSSDVTLATFELGIESQVSEKVSASVLLLHEEDEPDSVILDEGIITVSLTDQAYLSAGRMYVPFGAFETNLVSDPLTLEVGETNESAILVGFESDSIYSSVYMFNGDTITVDGGTEDDDTVEHFGASFGYMMESDSFGVDYISNAVDTDSLQELAPQVADYVSGIAVHAIVTSGELSVIAEHVQVDQLDEVDYEGDGASITATNLELAYGLDWGTAAIAYQSTAEALALELPETSILIGVSHDIDEATTITVEYAMHEDYADDVTSGTLTGSGNDATSLTVQLATSF